MNSATKARKNLSAHSLIGILRARFGKIRDPRTGKSKISLTDTLMAAFAMFSLKDSSLLEFDGRRNDPNDNFHTIYGIVIVPCDTRMREIADEVEPDDLRPSFTDIFAQLQRGKVLEPFRFLDGTYLLSIDGTGCFSSPTIHCTSCMEKHHRNGAVTYYHQMLGATIVHPDLEEVIPLCPEPIVKQDGENKNDCERNAAARLLDHIAEDHPRLRFTIIEDGLSSNAPHILKIKQLGHHFILGAKPGDHKSLFEQVAAAHRENRSHMTTIVDEDTGIIHHFHFVNDVALNDSHPNLKVNFLEYSEIRPDGSIQYFSWVTDFELTADNVFVIMRAGRARWKIENETFNTLKNQGYNFEHNFGHGKKHLSVVLALLMFLAFLVDQVQQLTCPVFQAARKKFKTKRALWKKLRNFFDLLRFDSMTDLLSAIAIGVVRHYRILEPAVEAGVHPLPGNTS